MSVRFRNGHKYYRYTVWDKKTKTRRYLERTLPIRSLEAKKRINNVTLYFPSQDEVDAIFMRFKEPSTAFIPLHFIFFYHYKPKDIYDLTFTKAFEMDLSDDTKRLLQRQKQRISEARRLFNHEEINDYVVVNLRTGKKLSNNQIYYLMRVIRKDICSDFRIEFFSYSEKYY